MAPTTNGFKISLSPFDDAKPEQVLRDDRMSKPKQSIKITPFDDKPKKKSGFNVVPFDDKPKKKSGFNVVPFDEKPPTPMKPMKIDSLDPSKPIVPKKKEEDRLSVTRNVKRRKSLLRNKKQSSEEEERKPRVTFVNSLYPPPQAAGKRIEQPEILPVDDWYEDTGMTGFLTFFALIIYPTSALVTFAVIWEGMMTPTIWLIISHSFMVTLCADLYSNWYAWKIMFRATHNSGYVEKMKEAKKLPSRPKARRRTNDMRKSQIQGLNPTEQQRKDRASVGIVHASHFHISFVKFLYYHVFFFRIDWIWNAYTARVRHLLICLATKLGYATAYRWYTHYSPLYEKSPRHQGAALLLESSLMLGLTEVNEDANVATFKYTNWYVPAECGVSQILMVNLMTIVVDLEEREIMHAEINGEEWTDMVEVLQIIVMAHSIYYHVLIHLYSNWWFIEDDTNPLHDFGIYTLLTNSISIYFGAFFKTKESGRWMFMKNAIKGIHYHHLGDLERFSKYSRSARFMLKARKIAKKYCTPENMRSDKVGFESFFIACVLHNIDHALASVCSNPEILEHEGPHGVLGSAWVRSMLNNPHREVLVKSAFKEHQIPWIAAMYKELAVVDKEYADYCHIGIRF